jgi:hypothetical protein
VQFCTEGTLRLVGGTLNHQSVGRARVQSRARERSNCRGLSKSRGQSKSREQGQVRARAGRDPRSESRG